MSFIKIPRRSATTYPGEMRDVLSSLVHRRFSRGPHVEEFERAFAGFVQMPHAVAVGSGRQAMMLFLKSAGLEPGDEVIVPAYTLSAIPAIIKGNGYTPRFSDIDPETFHVTAENIDRARSPGTRAVVVSHLFGSACEMREIASYCKEHGLFLIEDCAHSMNARYRGEKTGRFGDAAFFSFATDKAICCFLGGMAVTSNPEIARKLRERAERVPVIPRKLIGAANVLALEVFLSQRGIFSIFFITKGLTSRIIGTYRKIKNIAQTHDAGFCDLQAIAGLKQLNTFTEREQKRKNNARRIIDSAGPGARWQRIPHHIDPVYYKLILKMPDRRKAELVSSRLLKKGIDNGYGRLILDYCPEALGLPDSCPNAKNVFERCIQIPNHFKLKDNDIERIASALKDTLQHCR